MNIYFILFRFVIYDDRYGIHFEFLSNLRPYYLLPPQPKYERQGVLFLNYLFWLPLNMVLLKMSTTFSQNEVKLKKTLKTSITRKC